MMISKECSLFVLVCLFFVTVELKPGSLDAENEVEFTMVREDHTGRTKRHVSDLPDYLNVDLKVKGRDVKLRMKRSRVNVDAPVYFLDENGHMTKADVPDVKNVGLYQDPDNGAAIAVTAKSTKSKDGRSVRSFKGNFKSEGEQYSISPDPRAGQPDGGPEQGVSHQVHNSQKDDGSPGGKLHPDLKLIPTLTVHNHDSEGSDGSEPEEGEGESSDGQGPGDRDTATEDEPEDVKARILKKLKEEAREKARSHSRFKRQTQFEAYHVDITFLIDHTLWEFWLQEANNDVSQAAVLMKTYLSHQMNGMDLAYKSIDLAQHQIMISVWLHNYVVATTKATSTWTATSITSQGTTYLNTVLDGDAAISKVGEWSTQGGRGWNNPDHTMLWTRYNLFDDGTVGYAPIKGICRYKQAVSIIQDTGYHSWSTAAHELGHNLGAFHDGQINCPANDMYIMTAAGDQLTTSTLANAFTFSTCSINSMKDLLQGKTDGYPRVCLTDKTCRHGVSLEGLDELPGVKYSTQEQCELKDGPQAEFCVLPGEDICLTLRCSTGGTNCRGYSPGAAEGTTCATGKWCRSGKCVSKVDFPAPIPSTPNSDCTESDLPRTVPAGCTSSSGYRLSLTDASGNVVQTITCATIAVQGPQYCFTVSSAITRCCADCRRAGLVTPTQQVEEVTPSPAPGGTPPPAGGNWGSWVAWSQCTVSCAGGSQSRTRTCDNPPPPPGGQDCVGSGTETQACNTSPCPGTSVSSRLRTRGIFLVIVILTSVFMNLDV